MRKKTFCLAACLLLPLVYVVEHGTGSSARMDEQNPSMLVPAKQGGNSPIVLTSKVFTLKSGDLALAEEKVRSLLESPEVAGAEGGLGFVSPGLAGGGLVALDTGGVSSPGGLEGAKAPQGAGAFGLGGVGMFGFAGAGGPGGIGGGTGLQRGIGGQPTPGGFAGPVGFGALGGGMMGGSAGMGHGQAPPTWRMVIDDRTRSLIFRGSPDDLQTVSEIVSLVELPSNKPLPALQRMKAFRLKHANAADLVEKLTQLEMDVRLSALDASNILIAVGSEPAKKEIADLVRALDIEVKVQ